MTCQAESERYLNVVSVVHGSGLANIRLGDDISARRSPIMELPSGWARLGEGGKNGSQASRSATPIEDMFSACDKFRPDSPTRNAYRTIRGGRVARDVSRSRDFEDGKVAESSTIQAQCGLPKADQILPGSDRSAVDRRPQAAPGWPVPAAETQDSVGPHGQADRCVTSWAMPAAGINAGRHPYSLDWENLSDAERNLRVRLSENVTVMHVHHG
jgi:hypothetical protein